MENLTENEVDLLMQINEVYSMYAQLPIQHYSDKDEFVECLHRLQHLVMIRPTRRANPDLFPMQLKTEVSVANLDDLNRAINDTLQQSLKK